MNEKFMQLAYEESIKNKENDYQKGGPFGAVIILNDEVIASCHNEVIVLKDPTAHAEINAIREACKKLNTHDLKDCILYTSAYPCPMCLSAIIWANIKKVYYGNTKEDSDHIGFRDDFIYQTLNNLEDNNVLKLIPLNRELTIKAFEDYTNNKNKILY